MCGVVGYIGHKSAAPVIFDALKKLEYRGYDSAGIAVLKSGDAQIHRAEGKLSYLVEKVGTQFSDATVGIGHTRWATHGKPSEANAHPHRVGRVVLVHNGIVENYYHLRDQLISKPGKQGKQSINSETDTEIICHLINGHLEAGGSFFEAIEKGLKNIEGTYALALLDVDDPGRIYAAKRGSPLVIGLGERENFIASDIPAILSYTRNVVFLEDDEMAVLTPDNVVFYGPNHQIIQKKTRLIEWSAEMAEKGGFKHFMLKEIMEQPRAVEDTLRGRVLKGTQNIDLGVVDPFFLHNDFYSYNRFYIVACGTSWHAAIAGKYFLEAIAKIPVSVDTASEFRYREPFVDDSTLLLVISQSGETADTLACVQEARKKGASVLSICNVIDSSIPRHSHATLYTHAGPEIGVASTKAFTTQLTVLLILALHIGKQGKKLEKAYIERGVSELLHLPILMAQVLEQKEALLEIAKKYSQARDFYFIARGVHFPIALEGALKLKEISYLHAEGYSAGEMKHGPIALIEPSTPVVALAPKDRVCEKMLSNIEEVRARGASVIAVATVGDTRCYDKCAHVITLPKSAWYITPILASLPLQLLAYYIADLKGCDVDQPRNLAKSVTVE